MSKVTVQRAWLLENGHTQPALLNSRGEVFTPDRGWRPASEDVQPVAGETYERWPDVPSGWLGGVVTSW